LIEKFNVQTFPRLIVVTDAKNYRGIEYEGELKKDQLMKFLRTQAFQAVSAESE
jgi:hypothetical protein